VVKIMNAKGQKGNKVTLLVDVSFLNDGLAE
jgi:hypothetical protein